MVFIKYVIKNSHILVNIDCSETFHHNKFFVYIFQPKLYSMWTDHANPTSRTYYFIIYLEKANQRHSGLRSLIDNSHFSCFIV